MQTTTSPAYKMLGNKRFKRVDVRKSVNKVLTWKPSLFEIIANRRNSEDVRQNLRACTFFPNGSYIYKPSDEYKAARAKYLRTKRPQTVLGY